MTLRRSLALGGLLLSLSACQAMPPGGPFSFSLDTPDAATPVETAGRAAAPDAPPAEIPAFTGGSLPAVATPGGSGGAAARATGVVTDEAGRPLAGATVSAGAVTATTDAAGAFAIAAAGPLTASLAGYGSQTLPAPFRFALSALAREPGAPYTLLGGTQPPVSGAQVLFVDAAGTSASALTAADGSFRLEVEPRAAADTPGLLAVTANVAMPLEPRFGLLQVASPLCGALRLAHPAAGRANVALQPATGALTLAPAAAPLAVHETTLQLVDGAGLALPLGATEGPFPASVPTFALPGLHLVVTLQSSDSAGQSAVERVDPVAGETWRPRWLAPPVASVADDRLHVEAQGRVAIRMGPLNTATSTWQAIADPGAIALPPRDGGAYFVDVSAFDGAPATALGMFGGAQADRRSATTRLELLPPLL